MQCVSAEPGAKFPAGPLGVLLPQLLNAIAARPPVRIAGNGDRKSVAFHERLQKQREEKETAPRGQPHEYDRVDDRGSR